MKPTMDKTRPLSWSALSSFEYDPEQWWNKYCLHGKCTRADKEKAIASFCVISGCFDPDCPVVKTTPEMEFGTLIGESFCTDNPLAPVIRYNKMEEKVLFTWNKIPCIGYLDSWKFTKRYAIREYKTGVKKWDQKRVDTHGQIDFYLLGKYQGAGIRPDEVDVDLDWYPTRKRHLADGFYRIELIDPKGQPVSFKTKRTMTDLMRFGTRITKAWEAMEQYALNHPWPLDYDLPKDAKKILDLNCA